MWKKICTLFAAALVMSLLVACATPQEKSVKFMTKGKGYFDKGDYDKARLEFQNALQLDPKSAEAYYLLAMVRLRQKNIQEAFNFLRKSEELDPNHRQAKLELAKILVASGEIDDARKKIDVLIEQDPKDSNALLVRAAILLYENKTGESLTILTALQADNVTKQDLYILLSAAYEKNSDQPMVEKVLQEGVEKSPEKASLFLMLVSHYESANQIPRAIAILEQYISQAPDARPLRFRLADLLWKNSEQEKARKIVDELIASADKADETVFQDAALFLDARGDKENARRIVAEGMTKLPNSFKPLFQLVEFHLADGKRDEAIALLKKGLTLSKDPAAPGVLDSRDRLASIYLGGGELDKAEEQLNAVLKESPKNIDANFFMGKLQLERGASEKAIVSLRTVVADRPDFLDGHLELANAHINNKELGQAAQVLGKAQEIFPYEPELMRKIVSVNLLNGDKAAAQDMTVKLSTLFPDDLKAKDLLGQLAEDDKKPEKAAEIFRDIIKKDPNSPLGYIRLSQLFLIQGDEAGMERILRDGLVKLPESVEIFVPLVRLSMQQNKTTAAEALCKERLVRLPDDPMAHHLTGLMLLKNKKFAEALVHFRKATDKIPSWQEPLVNTALALLAQGDKAAAIEPLQRSMEINPADPPTHATLAAIFVAEHQTDKAIEVYEKALAKNAKLWSAANDLSYLLAERNRDSEDLNRALTLARQALELEPEKPAVNDTLGWVLYKRGEYSEAVAALEKAKKIEKQAPAMLLYHLGMALHKSGRTAEARTILESALKSKETFPGREEAEAIISRPS